MFSQARTIFTAFGLRIRVDPSWLLIAALITWSLAQHMFPSALPGQPGTVYTAMAIVAMLVFFGSLILHELSHALTARHFGVETQAITLFLFGGVAELASEPDQAMHEFWIAIAGPIMSCALAFSFWVFGTVGLALWGPGPVVAVLEYLALINLVLAVFNLLPAFPLDGGRVLRAWLWHRGGDVMAATESAARSGSFLAYGLILLGVIALFQGAIVGGFWQILLGTFVLAAARGSVESQRMKTLMGGRTVRDLMTRNPVSVEPRTSLAALVNQAMLRNRVSFVPVIENGVLLGYVDTTLLNGIDRENWANTQVDDVFASVDDGVTVPPDTPVLDLFERIAQTGQRKFLVVEHGNLLGVVTLSDLTRYLGLMTDLGRMAGPTPATAVRARSVL